MVLCTYIRLQRYEYLLALTKFIPLLWFVSCIEYEFVVLLPRHFAHLRPCATDYSQTILILNV